MASMPQGRFMQLNKQYFLHFSIFLLTMLTAVTYATAQSPTAKEKVLVGFNITAAGPQGPNGGLIRDAAGNFYGVTPAGGIGPNGGNGTVFEVSPAPGGGWMAKALYRFHAGTQDGQNPLGGLVMDSAGNLYGTTSGGGANLCSDGFDNPTPCGTAFELSPNGSGGWTEKIIYNFGQDASSEFHSLIIRR
jgi:hypothetical protein